MSQETGSESPGIRLSGVLSDPFHEENPYAINGLFMRFAHTDPTGFRRQYAKVSPLGTVVEADTIENLEELFSVVVAAEPLLQHMCIKPPTHVFNVLWEDDTACTDGVLFTGRCMRFPEVDLAILQVVTAGDAASVMWSYIHEIAHLLQQNHEPAHGVHFWLRYGEYLEWWFQQEAMPYKSELEECMAYAWDLEGGTPYFSDEFYYSDNPHAQEIAAENCFACVSCMTDEHREEYSQGRNW